MGRWVGGSISVAVHNLVLNEANHLPISYQSLTSQLPVTYQSVTSHKANSHHKTTQSVSHLNAHNFLSPDATQEVVICLAITPETHRGLSGDYNRYGRCISSPNDPLKPILRPLHKITSSYVLSLPRLITAQC